MASTVLKIQTNRKGLAGPIQLTSEKLNIRIITPISSNIRTWDKIKALIDWKLIDVGKGASKFFSGRWHVARMLR